MDLNLLATLDVEAIADPAGRQIITQLLGLIEQLAGDNARLRAENQQLRDEIARLKGEQGQPTIRPRRGPGASADAGSGSNDHSSEAERHTPTPHHKGSKQDQLTVTRTERLAVDRARLPEDAVFKDLVRTVVQDLHLTAEVICFEREVWYSPGQHQSYQAPLPPGYSGAFGPDLKSLALTLHFGANVTQAKLLELFRDNSLVISHGWLGDLLSGDPAAFGAEAREVERAGLASSPWQHLDDTATRVDGQNEYCQVLGNELFTVYHTTATKDRLAVLDVLRGGGARTYRLDATAEAYLDGCGLAAYVRQRLGSLPRDQELSAAELEQWVTAQQHEVGPRQVARIQEALGIAAYRAQTAWPVIRCLVCDDAPQFRWLTAELALCWVHEGRHYAKLTPFVARHRELLDEFRQGFWGYYRALLAYKVQPGEPERVRLEGAFDALFATETGYAALDARIALTRAKKDELLRVLAHPGVPLHNNPAELAARRRVRKRDTSFGPRSAAGRWAWDTYQTLAATTRQLGLSFRQYLADRLQVAGQVPRLAEVITERAKALNLAGPWAAAPAPG